MIMNLYFWFLKKIKRLRVGHIIDVLGSDVLLFGETGFMTQEMIFMIDKAD